MNTKGVFYLLGAYTLWGGSALFWRHIDYLDPLEITIHRVFWSVPILLAALYFGKQISTLQQLHRKDILLLGVTSALVSSNWLVFIWAIANNRLLEASLGYFIFPLLTVLLGVFFLQERLQKMQWFAIFLATIGAGLLVFAIPHFPWVALSLASTFAAYALLRKQMSVGALLGLSVEVFWLLPFAIIAIVFLDQSQSNHFSYFTQSADYLIPLVGVLTVLPLLWMVSGTKLLTLGNSGILFYWNPTLQFLIAVFIFHEEVNPIILSSFVLIWIASIIYFIFDTPHNIFTNKKRFRRS